MHMHRHSGYHIVQCHDYRLLVRDIPVVDWYLLEENVAGVPRPLVNAYQKTKCHVLEDGNLYKCRDSLSMLPLKTESISINLRFVSPCIIVQFK
jgi:hypothetical protein